MVGGQLQDIEKSPDCPVAAEYFYLETIQLKVDLKCFDFKRNTSGILPYII